MSQSSDFTVVTPPLPGGTLQAVVIDGKRLEIVDGQCISVGPDQPKAPERLREACDLLEWIALQSLPPPSYATRVRIEEFLVKVREAK
jgi:hypothetical protein